MGVPGEERARAERKESAGAQPSEALLVHLPLQECSSDRLDPWHGEGAEEGGRWRRAGAGCWWQKRP